MKFKKVITGTAEQVHHCTDLLLIEHRATLQRMDILARYGDYYAVEVVYTHSVARDIVTKLVNAAYIAKIKRKARKAEENEWINR